MSQIHVNVGAPGEIVVPNTGMLTYTTGAAPNSSSTFYADIGIIIAAILAIILPVVLIRKKLVKKPTAAFSLFSRKNLLFKFALLALFSFGIAFSALVLIKYYASSSMAAGQEYITITDEDIIVNVEIEDEPVFVAIPNTVRVRNDVTGGYTLSLYGTEDLVLESDPSHKISGLGTADAAALNANTWGLSLTAPESQSSNTYQSIPSSSNDSLVIKRTTEDPYEDETTVYYGFYITPDLPHGTYSGTINYDATINAIEQGLTIIFHGNGLYFDEEGTQDTNTVVYANVCTKQYGYVGTDYQVSHTSNIDEDGNQNGRYTEDEFILQTYSFDGADMLKVDITYDFSSNAEAAIITGAWDGSGELGEYQIIQNNGTKTIIVQGSAVTMYMESWGAVEDEHNYGYYTKIYPIYNDEREGTEYEMTGSLCRWQAIQGEYKEPILENGIERDSWHGSLSELGSFDFKDEEELLAILNDAGVFFNGETLDTDAILNGDFTIHYDLNGGHAFICTVINYDPAPFGANDAKLVTGSTCPDGYEGSISEYTETVSAGETVSLFNISNYVFDKNGYDIIGWARTPDATTIEYDVHEVFTANNSITLYAVWADICEISHCVTIIYNANGGYGAMSNQIITSNTTTNLKDKSVYYTDHTFLGWNTEPDGTGIGYSNKGSYAVGNLEESQTVTLYAQWDHIITIFYYANGGTGYMSQQILHANSSIVLFENKFTYGDNQFLGWNTEPNGTGTSYSNQESYSVGTIENNQTILLYAQWSCGKNTICYKANGDHITGTMNNQIAGSNEEITLTAPGYARIGYGFVGWSEDPSADPNDSSVVIYGPNQTITTGDLSQSGLVLYAIWLPADSVYTMQSFDSDAFETANPGIRVTALLNESDNKIYTVSKLNDGKWWTTENINKSNNISWSAAQSVCPSNWLLTAPADYYNLLITLGGSTNYNATTNPTGFEISNTLRSFPQNFVYTKLSSQLYGDIGQYWTTVGCDCGGIDKVVLRFHGNNTGVMDDPNGTALLFRNYGGAARCILE